MKPNYRCWAEIDCAALRHNATVVRERIGSAEMLSVVKANAYGHGLMGVAETLSNESQLFGVANLEEALALRESLSHPIIILGPAIPEERSTIVERGFIPTISTFREAECFSGLASDAPGDGQKVTINFKVDTGMGRMGVIESKAVETFKRVAALPRINIHSISTHLPVSNEDADYTRNQLARFRRIVARQVQTRKLGRLSLPPIGAVLKCNCPGHGNLYRLSDPLDDACHRASPSISSRAAPSSDRPFFARVHRARRQRPGRGSPIVRSA